MENETRYDLNAAIENWRTELAAQPNLTAEVRHELETHLRDTITGFQQRGLNDEESFWLARRRVGQFPQLNEEFQKVDPVEIWRERLFWMWLALFLYFTLGSIGNSLAFAVLPHNIQSKNFMPWQILQIVVSFGSVLIPLLLAILLAKGKLAGQFSKLLQFARNRRHMTMAALTCILLSSAVRIWAWAVFYSRSSPPISKAVWIAPIIPQFIYAIIVGAILVWLVPQSKPTPKRA